MSILAPNPFRPPTGAELFAPLASRLGLTTLEIHASPLWGASQPDHRILLHAAITARVKELGCEIASLSPYPVSVPADLSTASAELPRSISISVSHALDVGGFALLSSHEGVVGFDIEGMDRVKDGVVNRIKVQADENLVSAQAAVPNDLFWTAKEAAFKALRGPAQPATITEIGLGGWKIANSAHFFEVSKPEQIEGLGMTLAEKTHALSLFVLKAST